MKYGTCTLFYFLVISFFNFGHSYQLNSLPFEKHKYETNTLYDITALQSRYATYSDPKIWYKEMIWTPAHIATT